MNGKFVTQHEAAIVARAAWGDAVEVSKPPADLSDGDDPSEWDTPGDFGPHLVAAFSARIRLIYAARGHAVDHWDESLPNLAYYMDLAVSRGGWSL